jgi:hypothetical protein
VAQLFLFHATPFQESWILVLIYDRGHLLQYYFGDINLPRDKFLQEQIKLEDGWVPLEVMLKFKRLSNLTTDCDVVVTALEASELMEVRTHFILLNEA